MHLSQVRSWKVVSIVIAPVVRVAPTVLHQRPRRHLRLGLRLGLPLRQHQALRHVMRRKSAAKKTQIGSALDDRAFPQATATSMAGANRRRSVMVGRTRAGAEESAADQDSATMLVGVARIAKCESCADDLISSDNGL